MFVTCEPSGLWLLWPKQVSATKMFKLFSSVINPFRFSEQNDVCTSVYNPQPLISLLRHLCNNTMECHCASRISSTDTMPETHQALFPWRAAKCYDFSIVITASIPNCLSAKISEVLHNYRPSLPGHIDKYLPVISESDVSRSSEDSWGSESETLPWLLRVLHPQIQWCHSRCLINNRQTPVCDTPESTGRWLQVRSTWSVHTCVSDINICTGTEWCWQNCLQAGSYQFYRNSNTECICMYTISNILKNHNQSNLKGNGQCRMDTAGVVYPL